MPSAPPQSFNPSHPLPPCDDLTVVTITYPTADVPCIHLLELNFLSNIRYLDVGDGHDASECHSLLLVDGINQSHIGAPAYARWRRNIEERQRRAVAAPHPTPLDRLLARTRIVFMEAPKTCLPGMLRLAMQSGGLVTTPFVLVRQLDRLFTRRVALGAVLAHMRSDPHAVKLLSIQSDQMTDRYPPDHLFWRVSTRFPGYNATRIMGNIGDHSHVTTVSLYRKTLLPLVEKERSSVPPWRACYIESYWNWAYESSYTLGKLRDRNFFLYNTPADFRFTTHLRIRSVPDSRAAQRAEYSQVRRKLGAIAEAQRYREDVSECSSSPDEIEL